MSEISSSLLSELQTHYDTGPGYAEAYLRYWFESRPHLHCESLADIMVLPPPEPMWFDYALSTNWRGGELARLLTPYIPSGARRYLDIGCGFGGCLVAMSRLGLEVQGVEIDPVRVRLAQANCADHGQTSCAHNLDILAEGATDSLGTFDLITLVDVIEHVLDVPATLSRVSSLLNPGGAAFLEIPNKFNLDAVAHDGHFSLFGITLLPRPVAIAYHRAFFAFDYDVGDYYNISHYIDLLRQFGCEARVIPSPLHTPSDLTNADSLHSALINAHAMYREQTAQRVSADINDAIERALEAYERQYAADLAAVHAAPGNNDLVEAFQLKYLTDFWSLIAVKSSPK